MATIREMLRRANEDGYNDENAEAKLQFPAGKFDMVVFDPKEICCEIYEVKYSKEAVAEQYRHLEDEENAL